MAAKINNNGGLKIIRNDEGFLKAIQTANITKAITNRNQTIVTGSTLRTAIFNAIARNPQKKAVIPA